MMSNSEGNDTGRFYTDCVVQARFVRLHLLVVHPSLGPLALFQQDKCRLDCRFHRRTSILWLGEQFRHAACVADLKAAHVGGGGDPSDSGGNPACIWPENCNRTTPWRLTLM